MTPELNGGRQQPSRQTIPTPAAAGGAEPLKSLPSGSSTGYRKKRSESALRFAAPAERPDFRRLSVPCPACDGLLLRNHSAAQRMFQPVGRIGQPGELTR